MNNIHTILHPSLLFPSHRSRNQAQAAPRASARIGSGANGGRHVQNREVPPSSSIAPRVGRGLAGGCGSRSGATRSANSMLGAARDIGFNSPVALGHRFEGSAPHLILRSPRIPCHPPPSLCHPPAILYSAHR
eukprot:3431436-Pyramimonas_sp.AAC.1